MENSFCIFGRSMNTQVNKAKIEKNLNLKEDVLFGQLIKKTKTSKTVSKSSILKKLK